MDFVACYNQAWLKTRFADFFCSPDLSGAESSLNDISPKLCGVLERLALSGPKNFIADKTGDLVMRTKLVRGRRIVGSKCVLSGNGYPP